jgi:enhancer of yellow 2 transcription factor
VNPLTLRAILQQLLSHAQSANFHSLVRQYADFFHHSPAAVPPPVKREITTLIKQFVKEQFDK